MAPASRREWVEASLAPNPRFGIQKTAAVLRVFDIMVEVMFFHLPYRVMTRDS